MFVKNEFICQKLKMFAKKRKKIVKTENFCQKWNVCQKLKIFVKNEMFVKNWKCLSKMIFLSKMSRNQFFDQTSIFSSKIKIWNCEKKVKIDEKQDFNP